MSGAKSIPGCGLVLAWLCLAGFAAGQDAGPSNPPVEATKPGASLSLPASKGIHFDDLLTLAIRQERRLADLLGNFHPIAETYMQEEHRDPQLGIAPTGDQYFLSRLDLTGSSPSAESFLESERPGGWEHRGERSNRLFVAVAFVQPVFVDKDHFDRQNYRFSFVRWETLGEVRCAVIDVQPREDTKNLGFTGRLWVEDHDFNIVRFSGTFTGARAFHFDSWRLNILGVRWMPSYIYAEESNASDPASHVPWFKAQTRIWGYDMAHAGDHREYEKRLTDTPTWVDPNRHEASQDLSPTNTVGTEAYTAEDKVVERLQIAGLMAPDGVVDDVLQTVVNNLLITNNLDVPAVRCRVLLTTPLESFVVGRTIVISKGLLDVLPDEASLGAVLAHELAHIILKHSIGGDYLANVSGQFPDLEILSRFEFRFSPVQESEADRKGEELLAKSPYKDQLAKVGLFLKALEWRSKQLPNLMHGRFSNDFATSHLIDMKIVARAGGRLEAAQLDQIAALPLGSRISVDAWSDRIDMRKMFLVQLETPTEKMPFEVAPFFPYLKRLESEKEQATAK